MNILAVLALLSLNAFAASPDRQFVCKFSELEIRAAIFANVSADGLRLKNLRIESEEGDTNFEMSQVPQFRYSSQNGQEDFYALALDNPSNAFVLEFSGSGKREIMGTFSQLVIDEKHDQEPIDAGNTMAVTCRRLL